MKCTFTWILGEFGSDVVSCRGVVSKLQFSLVNWKKIWLHEKSLALRCQVVKSFDKTSDALCKLDGEFQDSLNYINRHHSRINNSPISIHQCFLYCECFQHVDIVMGCENYCGNCLDLFRAINKYPVNARALFCFARL